MATGIVLLLALGALLLWQGWRAEPHLHRGIVCGLGVACVLWAALLAVAALVLSIFLNFF